MAKNENNQKANEEQNVQNQETAQQQNAQPETPVQQQATQPEEKHGFGAWLKKHWKGVTAGATAVLAAGGSAFVAYKKGKAAGMAGIPVQQDAEDYSLNPNE